MNEVKFSKTHILFFYLQETKNATNGGWDLRWINPVIVLILSRHYK